MSKSKLWINMVVAFIAFLLAASVKTPIAFSGDFVFETDTVRYAIGSDGASKSLLENKTGRELLKTKDIPFASIRKTGQLYPVSHVRSDADSLKAEFGQSGIKADFRVSVRSNTLVVELVHIYGDGVEEVRLAQLRLVPLENSGPQVPVQWSEAIAVSLMGLSDRVHSRIDESSMLIASVYPEFGMEGQKVAIVAVPTPKFLDTVQVIERDFQLPSPALNGQWAKSSPDIRESYLFTDLTEANADETIRFAKLAGFKYILIYSSTWSTSNGTYPINTSNYPRGEASLKAVIDKCHAAGIKVGMHMLTSFVGKNDPLVRPVPDSRLLKDAEAVLAANLDVKSLEIMAISGLADFPRQQAYYGAAKAGLDIQIDDEIIHYSTIGGPKNSIFLGCTRGYAGTRAAQHSAGTKISHLAERYGSYLVDLRTPLKERISERIAGVINRCGFDMIYFDGGEVNDANGPAWYWVSQQQMDIWKRVNRDLLVQGSGMTPWTWHIFGRGTCDDYAAVATKEYLDSYKISYVRQNIAKNFLTAELGWWGFLDYAPHHPATSPDEVELYAVRMLSLDAPVSLETTLKFLRANGRTAEMLTMLGQYEQLRLQRSVSQSVRERLSSGEWHMRWKGGKPVFQPVRYDVKRVEIPGEVKVLNKFGPQEFKFRLQSVPVLSKVGEQSNIVLYGPNNSNVIKPAGIKATMPGVLAERVDYTKPANEHTSVFIVGSKSKSGKTSEGKALDLTTHRALAVRLKVDGPAPKPGESSAVLNLQLESGGKTYRDYYVDLNFTGERTIIIPEPSTERMLREFWPAQANYAFKAAMYDFNYANIVALNIRWMRQPAGKPVECSVSLVEALTETDSEIINPSITIGTQQISLPITLRLGDYAEYWGYRQLRVFDRNGVQLSSTELPAMQSLLSGSNKILIGAEKTGSVELTTIFLGDAIK